MEDNFNLDHLNAEQLDYHIGKLRGELLELGAEHVRRLQELGELTLQMSVVHATLGLFEKKRSGTAEDYTENVLNRIWKKPSVTKTDEGFKGKDSDSVST